MENLSVYILTKNSEKYLEIILNKISSVADEIIILDSGSTDSTKSIAQKYGVSFHYRALDNFKNQRNYAAELCQYNRVLALDSDEVPNDELVDELHRMKQEGFLHEAYSIKRDNHVMGKSVTVHYPVVNPDYVTRLFDKRVVRYTVSSRNVHENPSGYKEIITLEKGCLRHYTFETITEINRKCEQYSDIGAMDILENGESALTLKKFFMPYLVWGKWYLLKGGWKDGKIGWTLGKYTFNFVYKRYNKAIRLKQQKSLARH